MKKIIHKCFWAWNFDKEENWLNEMSAKGLQLCKVGFCRFVFEEGLPGEYAYRLELLNKRLKHSASVQYIRSIEDTGAEHIGSVLNWVYFRKKTDGNGFDFFSDNNSRIQHLSRILSILGILSVINIFSGFNQIVSWTSSGISINLITAIINFAVGGLLGYGSIKIFSKQRKLKKEKN